jgi:arabinofuranosyltransferase
VPAIKLHKQHHADNYFLKYGSVAVIVVLLILALVDESPLTVKADSGFDADEGHRHYSWRGILNERNFYFKTNSLWAYVHRDENQPFPHHRWCLMGINAAAQNKQASDFGGIGMYGYCAGLNLLVIDNLALGEPFLARLPMSQKREWRAGHYHRDFPQGYYESRVTHENHLQEPHLALLWNDISQLVHEPLFTLARWQAIWRINTGYYKNIGDYYFADIAVKDG